MTFASIDVADAHVRPGQLLAGEGLLHDRAGDVDRDGEADAGRVALDGGVDADDRARGIESGPPLFPGLIAASVWIRFVSWSSAVATVRPVAEMIPVVTVLV